MPARFAPCSKQLALPLSLRLSRCCVCSPPQPSRTPPRALVPSFLRACARRSHSVSLGVSLHFLLASALSCLVRAGRSRSGCTDRSPRHPASSAALSHPMTLLLPLSATGVPASRRPASSSPLAAIGSVSSSAPVIFWPQRLPLASAASSADVRNTCAGAEATAAFNSNSSSTGAETAAAAFVISSNSIGAAAMAASFNVSLDRTCDNSVSATVERQPRQHQHQALAAAWVSTLAATSATRSAFRQRTFAASTTQRCFIGNDYACIVSTASGSQRPLCSITNSPPVASPVLQRRHSATLRSSKSDVLKTSQLVYQKIWYTRHRHML